MIYCWGCGKQLHESAPACPHCGAPQKRVTNTVAEEDPALKYLIPIGRSAWAIAAGYLGLFAVLLIPAPLALGAGILALRDIGKHPEKFGRGRAWFGIVLGLAGTLFLISLPIIGCQH